MKKFGRKPNDTDNFAIIRIIILQIVAAFVLSIIFWLFNDVIAGYSAFFGGIISVIPNVFLAARLIASPKNAQAVMKAAYIGEAGKIILTFLLFGVVFAVVKPLDAKFLFISFIIVQFIISIELLRGK